MFFLSFRFRRRVGSILAIYYCFKDSDKRILHPSQISRETGIHMMTVVKLLRGTPELFFKVPAVRSTQVSGYALTTATHVRTPDEVTKFINRRALLENVLYWGFLSAILVAFVIAILTMIPVIGDSDLPLF